MSGRGGDPNRSARSPKGRRARPQFLPDGRHYLYLSLSSRPEKQGIYVGALDSDLRKPIVATEHNAAYSASGQLLFIKDGALMAQPFDAERLELSGQPRVVLDQVASLTGIPGLAQFSVSANGRWPGEPAATGGEATDPVRSIGRRLGPGEPAVYHRPVLSPDETRSPSAGKSRRRMPTSVVEVAGGAGQAHSVRNTIAAPWSPDGTGSRSVPIAEACRRSSEACGWVGGGTSPPRLQGLAPERDGLVGGRPVPRVQLAETRKPQDLFVLPCRPPGEEATPT